MAQRLISQDQIKINGSSQIYGGFIFNVNVNFSFSSSPTTVSVSVVSKDGNYNITPSELDTSVPQTLTIGDDITVDPIFLTDYEIQKNQDSNVLQLNFVDGSVILDKIFIGLNGIHGFAQSAPQTKFLEAEINCQPCPGPSTAARRVVANNAGIFKDGEVYSNGISRLVRDASSTQSTISKWEGGFLILGDEQFTSQVCEIPNISYNLTSLLNLLDYNGITIDGITDVNPEYLTDYQGTLREVLNNWCSDFGFTFYWNSFRTNTSSASDIIGIDLRNPVNDISSIKTSIESIGRDKDYVVSSLSEKYSLQNTKKTYHVSSFKKDMETRRSKDWEVYKQYAANCVTVEDLNPNKNMLMGRTYEQFITSCVLSRYSSELRDIYNWNILRPTLSLSSGQKIYNKVELGDIDPKILGINDIYAKFKIKEAREKKIFGKKTEDTNDPFKLYFYPGGKNPEGFPLLQSLNLSKDNPGSETYLVDYSEQDLVELKRFEREVADFIGKWYSVPNYWNNYKYCTFDQNYNINVTTNPDSQIYNSEYNQYSAGYDEDRSYPFSNVIKENTDGNIFGNTAVRIFERDGATYGIEDQRIDEIIDVNKRFLKNPNIKLEHNLSNYDTEPTRVDQQLVELAKKETHLSGVTGDIAKAGDLRFFNAPTKKVIDEVFVFSPLYNTLNNREVFSNPSNVQNSDCTTVCDYDLIEEVCRCFKDQFGNTLDYDGKVYPPYQGLNSKTASAFDVEVRLPHTTAALYEASGAIGQDSLFRVLDDDETPLSSTKRTITLPIQDDYYMYYKLDVSASFTTPSVHEIQGSLGSAGGLAQIEVQALDISNQINSYYDSSSSAVVTDIMVFNGSNFVPRTSAAYHSARVANLTDGISDPNHTVSASFVGFPTEISSSIDPAKGLTNFNVNYDENGAKYDLEFSTRPMELPKPEAVNYTIRPRLKGRI